MDSYLLDCFFRPVSSATPSVSSPAFGSGDLELEEGIEMLIERLEMPDLWLRPTIPLDYIKDLPTWRYGWSSGGEGNLRPSKPSCHIAPSAEDEDDPLRILEIMDADDQERISREGWCRQRVRTHPSWECNRRNEGDIHVEVAFSSSSDGEESGGEVGCSSGPPVGVLHTTDCAVCLDSYSHGTVICGLPCGHNYHRRCIMTWLRGDNHDCPVCRWPAYRSRPPHHVSNVQTRAE
ncbi:hypothetical protein J437_LFUL012657 [Ladona fulva]|uniref:RING-type domain-containing protein n=1 Tax=Ladona fulva TaxID=123851 RepID=A0A8K0KEG6_LADFU|nr:hypothetical protein J437_LFUL012657 [Ladona fulva]